MTRSKKPLSHTITVPGRPTPKGRPRLGRRGRVFTPEKTLEAEAVIRDAWDGPMFENPVSIDIVFDAEQTIVTVTEWSGTKSKLRGDLDNYIKTLMDGLNGVAWLDDKQVHHVEARKE